MRLISVHIALARMAVARWHRRQSQAHLAAVGRFLEGLRNET